MIFRGYDLDLLPFVGVPTLNKIWESASSILNPEIAEKYKNNFLRSAGLFRNRLMLLRRKYTFYKGVLRRDAKIMERYGEAMGEEMLDDRVLYAVNGCISHGEKLRGRLDEATENFGSYCRRHESEDYFPSIDSPASGCEMIGVCGCVGSKRPYMSSCVEDQTVLTETQAAYNERLDRNVNEIGGRLREALYDKESLDVLEGIVEHN